MSPMALHIGDEREGNIQNSRHKKKEEGWKGSHTRQNKSQKKVTHIQGRTEPTRPVQSVSSQVGRLLTATSQVTSGRWWAGRRW